MEEGDIPSALSEAVRNKLQNKLLMHSELRGGKMPQQILDFSDEMMAEFYQTALHLFEEKQYQDAADAYLFLAFCNSHIHDYWLGLGMSMQMCHDYESAIDAYELAAICDLESPIPYFYLAKCLFAIHDRESAFDALELAIENAQEKDEFAELLEQAIKAKETLEHSGTEDS